MCEKYGASTRHGLPGLLRHGLFVVLVSIVPGQAQVTLTGTVTEAGTDLQLPRASLVVKNTFTGTVADDEGNFVLLVDRLPVTLRVSYIGYETAEIEVTESSPLAITLDEISVTSDKVIIVGTRFVPRTVITSPVPVDNIKVEDLTATGQLTVDKMLSYAVPSYNSTQQTLSDATALFDPADLRGLGPSRTLVLINGKRKNPSALVYISDTPGKGEVGVDMKSIPVAAIERVEVLRDGASAQYGSDAIAGVINIVLKDSDEGTDVHFFSGTMDEWDGDYRGYSVDTGIKIGQKGFLHLTQTFTDQDKTNRAAEPGSEGLSGGPFDAPDIPWIEANPDLGMILGLPSSTTSDIVYNAKLPLQGNAELYSFGSLQYRKGESFAMYRTPYWVPDPHFLHHDEGQPYNGFHPNFETDVFDNTLAVGSRGQQNGWDFDISNTFGRNSVDYTVRNSLNVDLGARSPTTFRVGGYEFSHNVTNLDVARRTHNATISLGTEFRTENFVAHSGEEASYVGEGTQSFPGLSPQNEIDVFRYNIGLYTDVSVDVTEALLVGGAVRFEEYSDFGDSFNWKVNGRYKVLEDRASVRASLSTGFRAPSLHQIYLSNIQTKLSGETVSNAGTFNNESPILRDLQVPELKEEEATNVSAGFAFEPTPDLFVSLDVYQVDVDDRIVYSSDVEAGDGTTVVDQILTQAEITSLKFFTNAVNTRTRGIDLVANYEMELQQGTVDVNLAANINDTSIEGQIATPAPIAAADVEIFDRKEQSRILSARPEDKVSLGLAYTRGALKANLNNTRFGAVTWQHASDPTKDQTFDAKIVTDVSLNYQYSPGVSFGIGINNLFNAYPEEIDAKGDPGTNLGGRFMYPWEVNQFGFNGITAGANIRISF